MCTFRAAAIRLGLSSLRATPKKHLARANAFLTLATWTGTDALASGLPKETSTPRRRTVGGPLGSIDSSLRVLERASGEFEITPSYLHQDQDLYLPGQLSGRSWLYKPE